ncbi:MAG: hypothetical protein NVV82_13655 [Sporocytophaga sp.]|nr:hypothetical protein [Sporocytophaga sp.]
MKDKNQTLIAEIKKAEHALMIHLGNLVTSDILMSCINLVEKRIALELFLDMENKIFLKENPFIFNKCCELINKGGSVFLINNNATTKNWKCLIDFREFIYYATEEGEAIQETDQDSLVFQNALIEFQRIRQEGKPYLIGKDISIRFNVSEPLILKGDTVEVNWEVDGAFKVIVQGLGEVEAYGRKKIKLEQDTIIKIGASNKHQFKFKAIQVRVSETDPEITYDIGYISEGTKQYNSLVNSDLHPHVYGVSKGNQVKLTWNLPKATEVKILPFDKSETVGEFTFIPSSSLQIEIKALIFNKTFSRKIQLLVFPIPLHKENLISVIPIETNRYSISIPLLLNEKTENFPAFKKQEYLKLRKKIFQERSSFSEEKITLNTLKEGLFNFLKETYSHRKGIIKAIQSIQSYYEHPRSNRRNTNDSL